MLCHDKQPEGVHSVDTLLCFLWEGDTQGQHEGRGCKGVAEEGERRASSRGGKKGKWKGAQRAGG